MQFEYENTLHKVEGQLDIVIIKIINNTGRGIEVKNLGTRLLGGGGGEMWVPDIKSRSHQWEHKYTCRNLPPIAGFLFCLMSRLRCLL